MPGLWLFSIAPADVALADAAADIAH